MYNHPYISGSSVDLMELTFEDLKEIESMMSNRFRKVNHIKNNKLFVTENYNHN